jgi:hypothetical protein
MYVYAHICVRCSTYFCLCLVHMLCVCWSRSLARSRALSLCKCTCTHICMSVCTYTYCSWSCLSSCITGLSSSGSCLPTHTESSSSGLRACVSFLSVCVRACMLARASVPVCASPRLVPPPGVRGAWNKPWRRRLRSPAGRRRRARRAHTFWAGSSRSPRGSVSRCVSRAHLNPKP